eukprot:SAG11_NODE_96_length_17016_cov_18.755113_11_plen_164_part_00
MEERDKQWPSGKDSYELGEEIGRSQHTKIYVAKCPAVDGRELAVKIIDIDQLPRSAMLEELRSWTLNRWDHPNVIRFHLSFVSGHHLWVPMDYAGGGTCESILQHMSRGLDEPTIAAILRDALAGLCYLHGREQMHRDVRAANIFIHSAGRAALGARAVSPTP